MLNPLHRVSPSVEAQIETHKKRGENIWIQHGRPLSPLRYASKQQKKKKSSRVRVTGPDVGFLTTGSFCSWGSHPGCTANAAQAMALTLLQGAVYITWSKSEGHQQADCSRSLVHIHCCRCLLPVLLVQCFIEIFDIYCVCALARDSLKSGIFFLNKILVSLCCQKSD